MHRNRAKHQKQHPQRRIISKKAHQDSFSQPQIKIKVAHRQSRRFQVIHQQTKRPVSQIKRNRRKVKTVGQKVKVTQV
jgi:hypothetical protein